MPLLKQGQAEPATRGALVLDLGDLKRQAAEIIARAEREAEALRAAAREEAERLVGTADERGFAQGLERGLAEGRETGRVEGRAEALRDSSARLETLVEAWTEALDRWEGEFGGMVLAARDDVLRFALAVARKIVLRTVELDPAVVQDQLAESVAMLSRPSSAVVVVNPEDRPLVEEVLPALMSRLANCRHAVIEDDASIGRGGCIVRTAGGAVDATIETQLQRIAEALMPARPDVRGGAAE